MGGGAGWALEVGVFYEDYWGVGVASDVFCYVAVVWVGSYYFTGVVGGDVYG